MSLGLRIFMAIEVTLCYVPGIFLRVFPFKKLLSSKQKKELFVLYPAIVFLNILLLFFGLNDFATSTPIVRIDMLLIQILLVGLNIIIIKGYRREQLFTFGVTVVCMYMLLSTATYFSKFFFTQNLLYQYLFGTGLYILFMILGYFPVRYLLKKTVVPFLSYHCVDYWKNVWFIPLLLYISMFLALPVDQNTESFSMFLCRLFIGISIVIFARVVATNHQTLIEKQALMEQLNNSKLHYVGMQSKVEAARKINHDLKHILKVIRHYIETNDKSSLSDFCDSIEENDIYQKNVPYTGCPAADGVLYHYINRAETSDIMFHYNAKLGQIGIADIDLCVLIGNALENAFDGCLTVNHNRNITLTTERDGNTLSIMVQNSFDGKVNVVSERIYSRKRKQRIGVGMETMRSVCEKYKGLMKTDWTENTFSVLFVLETDTTE